MSPWSWYRARPRWLKVLLGAAALVPALILAYVGVRTLQYAAADADVGAYVPSGANVVLRARNLEGHLERIRQTVAWRVLEKKILKDPALRRELSDLLQSAGAPTLEDLQDERKPYVRTLPRALHALGIDLLAAVQVRASFAQARFCAVARLRWLHYLAAPLGRWVLPTETVGGTSCWVVRDESAVYYVAFAGALALISNDKALLGEALRRTGRDEAGSRPLEARLEFGHAPGLLELRKSLQDSGLFAYLKWETVRGMTFSADLRDDGLFVDLSFDSAQPLHPDPPPLANRAWAPLTTTGWMETNTGAADLVAWLRSLVGTPGPRDTARQTLQQALQGLDEAGLSSNLLLQLQDGLTLLTGVEQGEARAYSAVALILPCREPQAAVDAMNSLVRKIAGSWAESSLFDRFQVGEVTAFSWRWPHQPELNELLRPTYAAVGDRFILGNNQAFTEEVIRTAGQGGGFEETSSFRKLRSRLKELGFTPAPSIAAGFLYPPLLRESLDGVLSQLAKQLVFATLVSATLRTEAEADLRRQGRPLVEAEIIRQYNELLDRRIQEKEVELRLALKPMNALRWIAFETSTGPRGVSLRLAVELR